MVLSPNNVRLWNEWAFLQLKILQQPEQALQYLERALQIDPSFDWTYGQLGDVAVAQSEAETDPVRKQALFDKAEAFFREALARSGDQQSKFNYAISLGGILVQAGRYSETAEVYRQALDYYPESPTAWRVYELLAQIYTQLGNRAQAVDAINAAISQAPEEQIARLQALIHQLQSQP